MAAGKKKTPKVLADHKKVGKKFIPPLTHRISKL